MPDEDIEPETQSEEPKARDTKAPASKPSGTPASKPGSKEAPPPAAQRSGRILLISLAVIAVAAIAYRYMIAPQGAEQAAPARQPTNLVSEAPARNQLRPRRSRHTV